MSSPIYVSPDSATFHASPQQYSVLQAALRGDHRVSALKFTANGGLATVEGVDFSWIYDGDSSLVVTIAKKHGFLAGHMPNATIFDVLHKQLLEG